MCWENKEVFEEYFASSFKHGNILTKEQYDKIADDYDLLYSKFMPENRNAAILDIGCGGGHFLHYLKKKNYVNFLGIDISKQQVDYCKKNVSEKTELADGMEYLKDKNYRYDVVAAHDFLEHLSKGRIIPFLEMVHKSLKKGGVFIARTPNMSNPFSLDSRYKDFTHEVGFTQKSLYQVLWIAGFRDINVLPPKVIRARTFKNFVRKIIVKILCGAMRFFYYAQDFVVPSNLGRNLTVVAKKT